MVRMDCAPSTRARLNGRPLDAASGVSRKRGRAPTARMAAEIGATMREGSCSRGFSPNSGA